MRNLLDQISNFDQFYLRKERNIQHVRADGRLVVFRKRRERKKKHDVSKPERRPLERAISELNLRNWTYEKGEKIEEERKGKYTSAIDYPVR